LIFWWVMEGSCRKDRIIAMLDRAYMRSETSVRL
jgi:hypothetical protein